MIPRLLEFPQKSSFFLFGPRQCGKTTLVKKSLEGKEYFHVNLLKRDQFIRYSKNPTTLRDEIVHAIEKKGIRTIFIDEIQKIPWFLDEVHDIIESFNKPRFILTGSSTRKLKRGGANLLAGRALSRYLFPFLYSEISEDFNLEHALQYGTLPAVFGQESSLQAEILSTYCEVYLKEEIQEEGLVRNIGSFAYFLDVVAASFTEICNYSNVARQCNIDPKTVSGHYDILEDTFIGFRLPGWSESKRKQLSLHPKFYFFDNGITNALNRFLKDQISLGMRGRLFEQWLMNEIRANISYLKSDLEMHYWRTNHGAEVDLLITKRRKIIAAVEIKSQSQVHSADLMGLKSFHEEYPKVPLFVVSDIPRPFRIKEVHNVEVLPWKEFLSEKLTEILG